jgi:hypothetical protein
MCPAERPTGAEAARPLARPAVAASKARFSRAAAAQIVGLAPSALSRWEDLLLAQAGFALGEALSVADLVSLAVLSATVRCLGASAEDFAIGHARVFEALCGRPDVERLDAYVALVGRDSARLTDQYDEARCAAEDLLIIPLRPILADFRSQAFA